MALIITAPPPSERGEEIEWSRLRSEILCRLNVSQEYERLGIRFSAPSPDSRGWRECYAIRGQDNPDDRPSAAICCASGDLLGMYTDLGGGHAAMNFFDFAATYGQFGSFMEALKHYAEKAGVPLGHVNKGKDDRVLEKIYPYHNETGVLMYGVHRFKLPNGKKDFRQYPWKREDWDRRKGCMDGIAPLPYRLPEIASAAKNIRLWIFEGEKDADRAAKLGLLATTSHGGAKAANRTWPRFPIEPFQGREIVAVPDIDEAGYAYANDVCRILQPVAAKISMLRLPGAIRGDDFSSWLDSGHDLSVALSAAVQTEAWSAPIEFAPKVAEHHEGKNGKSNGATEQLSPEQLLARESIKYTCVRDVEETTVNWLVPGKIPLGKISLFAGEQKLGKSFVTLDFAARVSTGGEVPAGNGECIPQGNVILLCAEDDVADTIKPRLRMAGADMSRIFTFDAIKLSNNETPFTLQYISHLELMCNAIGDTKLIVIDPVAQFLGNGVDEYKNSSVRSVLGPLGNFAAELGVAVVIVTHVPKHAGNGSPINKVSGSLAFTAVSRANWLFLRDPNDEGGKRRLMLDIGCNLAEESLGLAYSIVDGVVEWEPNPVATRAEDILDVPKVRKEPGGKSLNEAKEWLKELFVRYETIPSNEAVRLGVAAGHTKSTLWNAREALGISASKVNSFQATNNTLPAGFTWRTNEWRWIRPDTWEAPPKIDPKEPNLEKYVKENPVDDTPPLF